MRQILRNLKRRKLRTALTVGGIMIGVFALTVMGAMSEKLTKLVEGGEDYYKGKVIVSDATSGGIFGGAPMTIDKREELAKVDGVKYVSPEVGLLFSDETGVSFGVPPLITSFDPGVVPYESFGMEIAKGRMLTADDRGKTVLGSDQTATLKTKVGDTVKIRDRDFEVVGILEKTLSTPDTTAFLSLADAQEISHATLPEAFQKAVPADKIVSDFAVYLTDPDQSGAMVAAIEEKVEGVKAFDEAYFKKQISQGTAIFNLIILSGALIAIIVGGFSIMNTLTFAVIERTREIGIKKAVGARSSRILKEFMLEAAVIGVIGGVVGIALGWLMAAAINFGSREDGLVLFLVTPSLIIKVFIFSVAISVIAGFFPARRASKLNPVEALRYE